MTSVRTAFSAGDEPVPGYRLTAFLGAGGFGEVWRATAPGGAPAALKIVDLGTRQGQKEFRALAVIKQLQHPNLVPIAAYWLKDADGRFLDESDIEEVAAQGRPASTAAPLTETIRVPRFRPPLELFIAMGLGHKSLSQRLAECRNEGLNGIPPAELLRYMEDAASAIDHLGNPTGEHGSALGGVQHGDIKPQNMLIVGGRAQICDFGLARVLTDIRKTSVAGSPVYMAPEVIREGAGSSAADQYSLAISYFELRTARIPFADGLSHFQIWQAHLDGALDLSPLEPREREVIERAAARDPSDRFASATEMVVALRKAVEARPEPPVLAPATADTRTSATGWFAGGLALFAIAAGFGWLLTRPSMLTQPPEFRLHIKPVQLQAGHEAVVPVQVVRGDVHGPIQLSWQGLPPGVNSGKTVVLPSDDVAAHVTFSVDPKTPRQTTTVYLLATADGLEPTKSATELTIEPVDVWLPKSGEDQMQWNVADGADYTKTTRWYATKIECAQQGITVPFVLISHQIPDDPPDFYMMQDKVDNELFSRFAAEDSELADQWKKRRRIVGAESADEPSANEARLPAMNVTWAEAVRCAAWLGGRLPTLAQWDKAAGRYETGANKREGPHLGAWQDHRTDIAVGLTRPREIGASPGDVSQFLCRDMSGNGLEWTRDNQDGDVDLRGRNYLLKEPLTFNMLDSTYGIESATEARPYIGFRVVIDDLSDRSVSARSEQE